MSPASFQVVTADGRLQTHLVPNGRCCICGCCASSSFPSKAPWGSPPLEAQENVECAGLSHQPANNEAMLPVHDVDEPAMFACTGKLNLYYGHVGLFVNCLH